MTQSSWVSMIVFFFFNDTATTEIYTLSLHDALPIFAVLDGGDPAVPLGQVLGLQDRGPGVPRRTGGPRGLGDRKSTRLNSSHANISYAVFCLKKKKNIYLSYAAYVATSARHSSPHRS